MDAASAWACGTDTKISDPTGSWSFVCRGRLFRNTGLHAFVRIMFPLDTDDLTLLRDLAGRMADTVQVRSGHGGLTFGYDPWDKDVAFEEIYAGARRFWGIDIEDLNATLPTTAKGIKAVNWLTLIGRRWEKWAELEAGLASLGNAGVTVNPHLNAVLLVAGPQPVFGDQNRPDASLDPYRAVAQALAPLFLTAHPDFAGDKFETNGNTLGWVRRFLRSPTAGAEAGIGGPDRRRLPHSRRGRPLTTRLLEREKGLEPSTSTLARWHSTTELLPRICCAIHLSDGGLLVKARGAEGRRSRRRLRGRSGPGAAAPRRRPRAGARRP